MLLFRFTATLQGGGGDVDVLLPAPAIDGALRPRAGSPSEADGDRGVWARRLAEGVRDVDVEVEAVLHERTVSIGLASNLAVGGTLALGIRPDVTVVLRCGAVEVATATVASREDQLVLAVTSDNGEVGAIP